MNWKQTRSLPALFLLFAPEEWEKKTAAALFNFGQCPFTVSMLNAKRW